MNRSNNVNNTSWRLSLPNIKYILYTLIIVWILFSGSSRRLQRGALTHKIIKPYPCTQCDRSYTNKGTLNRHLREECGKIPQYSCSYCQKAFHQRSNFKRHVWMVHKERVKFCKSVMINSLYNWFYRLISRATQSRVFSLNEMYESI